VAVWVSQPRPVSWRVAALWHVGGVWDELSMDLGFSFKAHPILFSHAVTRPIQARGPNYLFAAQRLSSTNRLHRTRRERSCFMPRVVGAESVSRVVRHERMPRQKSDTKI
jgi:hypothetical protein